MQFALMGQAIASHQVLLARTNFEIDGSPVHFGSVVYVSTNSGDVYALDAATGAVNWSRALGDGAVKGFIFPHFGTNNILLSTDTKLWSLADNGGTSAINSGWPVTVISSPSTPLFVPGTTKILVGSIGGLVFQVDAFNPLDMQVATLGGGTAAVGVPTMDVLNSMFYVGTDQGIFYGVQFPLP